METPPTVIQKVSAANAVRRQQGFYAASKRYRKRYSARSSSRGQYSAAGGASNQPATSVAPPRRIMSKYSGRELLIDDDQCEQLSEAFFQIPDKYYTFEQMFIKLFIKDDPEVALVFGLHGIPEMDLRRRTPFRTHVCKFQRFMTTVMDLLPKAGREEELIQIIRMVGRQHCNVKTLSFTAARWLSFKNALMSTFAGSDQDKYYVPWSILVGFLIAEIKDAYLSHIRHLRSNSMPLQQHEEGYKLEFKKRLPAPVEPSNDNHSPAPSATYQNR